MTVMFCQCNDTSFADFPFLTLSLETAEYVIPPASYLTIMLPGVCQVDILNIDNLDNWVLGLNFFHDYYVVFD